MILEKKKFVLLLFADKESNELQISFIIYKLCSSVYFLFVQFIYGYFNINIRLSKVGSTLDVLN